MILRWYPLHHHPIPTYDVTPAYPGNHSPWLPLAAISSALYQSRLYSIRFPFINGYGENRVPLLFPAVMRVCRGVFLFTILEILNNDRDEGYNDDCYYHKTEIMLNKREISQEITHE